MSTLCCYSTSGCTDHFAETEEEGFQLGRDIVTTFNIPEQDEPSNYEEPLFDPAELPGCIPSTEQHTTDMYKVRSSLDLPSKSSFLVPFKNWVECSPWCCSHINFKKIKGAAYNNCDLNGKCKQGLRGRKKLNIKWKKKEFCKESRQIYSIQNPNKFNMTADNCM